MRSKRSGGTRRCVFTKLKPNTDGFEWAVGEGESIWARPVVQVFAKSRHYRIGWQQTTIFVCCERGFLNCGDIELRIAIVSEYGTSRCQNPFLGIDRGSKKL